MKHYLKYIMLTLLCIVSMQASAQQITSVHGSVLDEFGPVMGAAVCEIDATGRIIESTTTDVNGNYSMKVSNPTKNKLRISFVGTLAQTLPFTSDEINVTLKNQNTLKEVTVVAK